jgi:hypothetical protein
MPSGDFQSKIGANPSDSYPIFAKASYWHFAAYCSYYRARLAQLGTFTRNLAL